jgi:tryptophan-rich sensory protein
MDNTLNWYQQLQKPIFAPPSYVFGIAWSILYPIIFASFGYTTYLVIKKEVPSVVLVPLVANLVFNFLFSPIQFGLQSNILAAVDIVLVIVTLLWFIYLIYPHSKYIAYAQVPYLLWGLFATILQFSITWLNR